MHGVGLDVRIDHVQDVGNALHVSQSVQVALQLGEIASHACRFFVRHVVDGSVLHHRFKILHPLDALLDRDEIGKRSPKPTAVHIMRATPLGLVCDC